MNGTSGPLGYGLEVPLRGTQIRGGGDWKSEETIGVHIPDRTAPPQIVGIRLWTAKDSTYNRVDGSSKAASSWPPGRL